MQGIAQINLADCDGSSEMQLRWYAVQVFSSCGPPRARDSERPGGAAGDPAQAAAAGKTVRVPASAAAAARCHGAASLTSVSAHLVWERSGARGAGSRGGTGAGGFDAYGPS